ncbi:MAG: hypothetical protein WKG07_35515 [Hymenobacter sp.]
MLAIQELVVALNYSFSPIPNSYPQNGSRPDAIAKSMLQKAEQNSALISDLQKQFKKARVAFDEMEKLFENGNAPKGRRTQGAAEVDADAPYGRKKDGTSKQRPGRVKTA